MSDYNFGRRKTTQAEEGRGGLDLKGLSRGPVRVDPAREERAIERGAELGFVDRAHRVQEEPAPTPARRTRAKVPQSTVFIKGPQELLDWFVALSNERGHKAYWHTLQELRGAFERGQGE